MTGHAATDVRTEHIHYRGILAVDGFVRFSWVYRKDHICEASSDRRLREEV